MDNTPLPNGRSDAADRFDVVTAARHIAYSIPPAVPIAPLKPNVPAEKEFGPEIPSPPADAPPEVGQLKHLQRNVLELMMLGISITEVARLANVSRMTIHRWMKSDPDFKAALKMWNERVVNSARAQLASVMEKAASVVARRVEQGDLRAAITVLRGSGALATGAKNALPLIGDDEKEQTETKVETDTGESKN